MIYVGDGADNMFKLATLDWHHDNDLGSWKFDIPFNEADGVEPAHVHVLNTQIPSLRGKIWIGINDAYPIRDDRRYIFAIDERTFSVNTRDRNTLFSSLTKALATNKEGITDLFEEQWQGGWYRDVPHG